jgi:hypothetical protein
LQRLEPELWWPVAPPAAELETNWMQLIMWIKRTLKIWCFSFINYGYASSVLGVSQVAPEV